MEKYKYETCHLCFVIVSFLKKIPFPPIYKIYKEILWYVQLLSLIVQF